MKKTKLLTSIAALALVLGLGACEVNVEVGDVDVGVDVNPGDSSEDNTGETPSEDSTTESTTEDNTSEDSTTESTTEDNTSEDSSEDETTSESTSEDNTSGGSGGTGEGPDVEIAQEILDAADDADTYGLGWSAFHGEYIDESIDETKTSYLTTDSDGLYGSILDYDTGDLTFAYYYQGGLEYVYGVTGDYHEVNDSSEDYDDLLDDYTGTAIGDAWLIDVDDDDITLNQLDNGYELIVNTTDIVGMHMADVEYVYITDLEYNVIAVGYGVTASGSFEGWYAEKATTTQVEASLEGFNPTDWGIEEDTYDGDPVADLLADVKENNNYSLTIEYYDWTSPTYDSESGMYQDFENDTISKNSERHYNVVITFTKDVMFIEYYYGLSSGSVYDIESYINNGDDMEVWWCTGTYSTTLAQQTNLKETNQSWQTKWKSETLLGLDDSLFVVDASSYDGSKVCYTVDIDSYATLTSLVDCLYHCANYYAENSYVSNISPFIYNLQTYWNTYGAPTVKSTYDLENEKWDTTMYYLEENVTKVNETTNEYQLKYHGATAYISDVGSTELAEIYASQLPIFAN